MKPFRTVAAAGVLTVAITVLPAQATSASILCDYFPLAEGCGGDPNQYIKISHNQQTKRAAEPSAWDDFLRNFSQPNPNFWYTQQPKPEGGSRRVSRTSYLPPSLDNGTGKGGGGPLGLCPQWKTQPC